ncbi:HAD family hydrolase, partial [Kitasatospora sp. NPDC059571]|uniref:HAD family hydrolase n=1 Tax=Kitasatospora sp. NPDC059571 TaxID=3346871 RepID=UPI0036C93503
TLHPSGALGRLDRASFLAAFDLAGAAPAADPDTGPASDDLRSRYRELTGHHVPAARWCLLRVLQAPHAARLAAGGAARPSPGARAEARRAQARAVQHFLAGAYLADLSDEPRGPWCVLGLDGVLETEVLGFPAGSPQGMLALRALRAHGHRVLLATGRSLPEVRDRCDAYRLSGGVGEYGAVCYDAGERTAHVLLPSGRWEEPDRRLRARLAALPGVGTDPLARWCVRARQDGPAGRGPLPHDTVAALLADPFVGQRFEAVHGDAQTDFVPRGADPADGLRALLERLGAPGAAPLLAVGGGPAEVPLLRWARYGFAARNGGTAVRAAGVPVLRHRYQAGLAEAVAAVVGHRPGGCPRCRPPRHSPQTRALLALLAVPEDGRAGAPARLLRLALADLALPRPGRGAGRR